MKVIVIGAGSVGMIVASFLSESFHDVTLIVRRNEQAQQLLEHGLVRKNLDGSIFKANIQIETNFSKIDKNTLVIVAVKYGQLQELYKMIETLPKETPLLFLQNGLAHYEEALKLPQNTILFGSSQFGAERTNDNSVVHRGLGVLKIAQARGENQVLQGLLNNEITNFPLKLENNAEQMLFEKALLNCFINPLTAILKVKNGHLIENYHSNQLLIDLYNELMEAFPEERFRFKLEEVKMLCARTATNTSSMLSDRIHHRPTEVETIVGAVIKRAKRFEKSVPILSTLYRLLLALEESGEKM